LFDLEVREGCQHADCSITEVRSAVKILCQTAKLRTRNRNLLSQETKFRNTVRDVRDSADCHTVTRSKAFDEVCQGKARAATAFGFLNDFMTAGRVQQRASVGGRCWVGCCRHVTVMYHLTPRFRRGVYGCPLRFGNISQADGSLCQQAVGVGCSEQSAQTYRRFGTKPVALGVPTLARNDQQSPRLLPLGPEGELGNQISDPRNKSDLSQGHIANELMKAMAEHRHKQRVGRRYGAASVHRVARHF
jgi:hypothetical protein